MADDMLISVGVKADFSSLKSESKAAADALRQAQSSMEEAYVALGRDAEKWSEQSRVAIREYQTNLAQAEARVQAASAAMASSMGSVGAAATHTVPQVAAASAAIREFEGALPIRAVERFLTNTLGMGPALQAAFPVIGGIAFGEMIIHIGGELMKFGKDASDLSEELGTSWMDAAILKMQGLDKEIKKADEDIVKIQHDVDQSISKQKETELKILGDKEGPGAEASQRAMMARDEATRLERMIPNLRERLALERAIEDAKYGEQHVLSPEKADLAEGQGMSLDPTVAGKEAEKLQAEIRDLEQKIATKREDARALDLQAGKDGTPTAAKAAAEEKKIDEERLKADEVAFNKLRISHQLTTREEEEFWTKRLATFGAKTSEYAAIVAKLADLYEKDRKEAEKAAKEAEKQQSEKLLSGGKLEEKYEEDVHKGLIDGLRADMKAREDAAEETAKAAEIQATENARLAEAIVQHKLATGAINTQDAAVQTASIHAEEYRARIKALTDELAELEEIQNLGGNTGKKQKEVGNQLAGLQGAAKVGAVTDSTTEAKKFEQPWVKAFDTITSQWMRVQDEMLRGQISITQGAERMASSMLLDTVHSYEQMIITAMRHEVMAVAAHATAEGQKTLATEQGTSLRGMAEIRENLKSIFGSAKSAAAGAWNAMAGIPIVGPELGAVAAAATFTGVMALAGLSQK
jgi:hypothetical protein